MTNQQILEKAIQKAIDGGWKLDWIAKDAFRVWYREPYLDEDGTAGIDIGCKEYQLSKPEQIIFNQDFAKALWGEEIEDPTDWVNDQLEMWQYHLQQMVIAEDPIKYLGDNL